MSKPRVLVLGGNGFIGRNLVRYLIEFEIASKVRVVDKTLVCMAYFNEAFQEIFSRPNVEYVQANLSNPDHISRAFNDPTGEYDIVIALAAETKYNQTDEIMYQIGITQLRTLVATEAARRGVTKYIEVSTGQVYDGDSSKPSTEKSPLKPWTTIAKYHLEAEKAIQQIPGLNYVIARLPVVYGPGDRTGLMSRVICAAGYQHDEETMEFLWTDDLRMHTLHVQDAAAGIWWLVCCGVVGEVYNIVDESDTTQNSFNKVLEQLFNVKTKCTGSILSAAASLKMKEILAEANQDHMDSWQELLTEHHIENTPLTSFVDKELIQNKNLCLSGEKIKALGFQLSVPQLSAPILRDTVEYWIQMKKFPNVLKPA